MIEAAESLLIVAVTVALAVIIVRLIQAEHAAAVAQRRRAPRSR